jgi:hypothetical protein
MLNDLYSAAVAAVLQVSHRWLDHEHSPGVGSPAAAALAGARGGKQEAIITCCASRLRVRTTALLRKCHTAHHQVRLVA